MPREEIRYRPGSTFTCWRKPFIEPDGDRDGLGPECGTEILMHGCHWASQVCPKCLAIYRAAHGSVGFDVIQPDFGAWFPNQDEIRANIAANGGQYVPAFQ